MAVVIVVGYNDPDQEERGWGGYSMCGHIVNLFPGQLFCPLLVKFDQIRFQRRTLWLEFKSASDVRNSWNHPQKMNGEHMLSSLKGLKRPGRSGWSHQIRSRRYPPGRHFGVKMQ